MKFIVNLFTIFLIVFFNRSYSQDNYVLSDESHFLIQSNILTYRIKYLADINDHYCNDFSTFYKNLLPNDNNILDYSIFEASNVEFPNDQYKIFLIKNNDYLFRPRIESDKKPLARYSHGVPDEILLRRKFLIGYDTLNEEVIFISGYVFKTCISQYFNLNEKQPESFNIFLSLKLFNYDIDKIAFKQKQEKHLLFVAYSKVLKDDIYIKVNPQDFDMLQVKTIEGNWTERGGYKWEKNKW